MAKITQQPTSEFKEYLRESGNQAGLNYIEGLEQGGHKLTIKGGGYVAKITLDCVYGYNVFEKEENKQKYANLLETSSEIGASAVTLAYCILDDSAHILIKGDSETAVKAYVRVINDMFEKSYDDGKKSIGYPFRPTFDCQEVKGARAIWNSLATIHGYSAVNAENYPYNSLAYLSRGNTAANLALGVELGVVSVYEFMQELLASISYKPYYGKVGKEKLNVVMEDLRKRYVYPFARVKEDVIALILGETCARTCTPYAKVAKKMKCYKNRHDLTVSTLCSFMIRRNCSFDEATTTLGMGTENPNNLVIEVLAELNRLTNYSYDYIVRKMMRINDSNYGLLITTFIHLHNAFGWNFPELCEKYHLKRDIMAIRTACNF